MIVSMLFRSIATTPTSRVRLTWLPFAEILMFSLPVAPLNWSVSTPAWPSTVSLPSPGFQTNTSLPAPSNATSLPLAAVDDIIAGAADDPVIAVAAVEREVDLTGMELGRVDGVVAGTAVDDERVVERLRRR